MSAVSAPDCPAVIAGGGLIGLSAAMFLLQQGVASIVVERLRGGSPLPRAAHFHLRTLELFRLAGIEDEVKRRSEDDFLPEGAIIAMDNLSGRKLADIIGSLNAGVEALSPCRRLFISQPSLDRSCAGAPARRAPRCSKATPLNRRAKMPTVSPRLQRTLTAARRASCTLNT